MTHEELRNLYASQNIKAIKARRIRWAGNVACMRDMRKVYETLVGKPERKRPLRRPRRKWEDNIRMDLREIVREVVDWIHLAQDRD
jgi:hypothetical protein